MDINDLRSLATVLVFLAFFGVLWWAYGPSRKGYFDKASQLPFADEADEKNEKDTDTPEQHSDSEDQQQKGDQA